ncbi:MAG: hypothetical protein Q8O38_06915 [Sulfurimicrobium sp.]|nr:hypothetical protein [Sulfurimicrobium sp.]
MNPIFLFLSALLLFTPAAEAVSWHTLQTSVQMTLQADEPQAEAVDNNASDRGKKKDRKLRVWDKITYSRPQQAVPGDFYYASAKSLAEINCTAHTLKPLQRIYYDGDGHEIKSIHYGASERNEVVVPDTPGESVFNFACAFKATKAIAKVTPRTKPQPRAETSQSTSRPATSKKKAKEAQKPQTAASAKSPPKPSSTTPTTKPVDTKKSAR